MTSLPMKAWLAELARALRRRNADGWLLDETVAELRAHLVETGEDPVAAFGTPAQYAAGLLADLTPTERPPSAADVRLSAEGIDMRFGRREVLCDVALHVGAGEVTALVGPNGAGKSTLLRICAGLASPSNGRVRVVGRIGYCPQRESLVGLLTPAEHFVLVGAGRGLGRADARTQGMALARQLSWVPDHRTVRELSGGTRQKLNLVLAALGGPEVLLLDEPYQGFDHGSFLDFWELVWRWRDQGTAIIVVTHRRQQLQRVDHIVHLGAEMSGT